MNNQLIGNMGLYYTCYHLSRLGWNVMPTSRNARGIDIIIYSQDTQTVRTILESFVRESAPRPQAQGVGWGRRPLCPDPESE